MCQLDAESTEGEVYEYAPGGTQVLLLVYDEGTVNVDYTLTLGNPLNSYFELNETWLEVKNGVNITRDIATLSNQISGEVFCNVSW